MYQQQRRHTSIYICMLFGFVNRHIIGVMKRYLTLLGQIGVVFILTYVMPAIVATVITFDSSLYYSWVTSPTYGCVMGIMGFFVTLFFVIVKIEEMDA